MVDASLPNGPASPETPVNVWLDGGLNAVDLVRRLHRAGLELKNEDGRVVLVLRSTDAPKSTTRTRLFEAHAIIEAARLAVVSKIEDTDDGDGRHGLAGGRSADDRQSCCRNGGPMMKPSGFFQLPAPHDNDDVCAYWSDLDRCVRIECIADAPEQLVAAGLADPHMVEKRQRGAPKVRRKPEERFQFDVRKGWVRLLRRATFEQARSMAGVQEFFRDGDPRIGASNALELSRRTGKQGGAATVRPVGRFRRVVQWSVIDSILIIPNWSLIKAQADFNRHRHV